MPTYNKKLTYRYAAEHPNGTPHALLISVMITIRIIIHDIWMFMVFKKYHRYYHILFPQIHQVKARKKQRIITHTRRTSPPLVHFAHNTDKYYITLLNISYIQDKVTLHTAIK
jgi:hypothetical protein